ncbi:hypothetical protein Tco_1213936 [Tanacetum coccineum]
MDEDTKHKDESALNFNNLAKPDEEIPRRDNTNCVSNFHEVVDDQIVVEVGQMETMASQTNTVVLTEGVRGGPGYNLKKRPSILDLRTVVPGEALEAGGVNGRGATIVMVA